MGDFIDWFKNCPTVNLPYDEKLDCSLYDPGAWPIIYSVVYPVSIILVYFSMVTLIGPWLMENVNPLPVSGVLTVYNSVLALANLFVACGLTYYCFESNYSIWCQSIVKRCGCEKLNIAPEDMIAVLIGIYHIIRIVQLGEGLFYIVRKRRTTLIKTTHHSSMVMLTWAGTKYAPGGTTAILVAICCYTFSVLYIYYITNGHRDSPEFWPHFNKFASTVQIIEFGLLGFFAISAYYWDCNYPQWGSIIVLLFLVKFAIIIISDLSWNENGRFSPSISLSTTGFGAPWYIDRNPNPRR